jgi:hypothetical protein
VAKRGDAIADTPNAFMRAAQAARMFGATSDNAFKRASSAAKTLGGDVDKLIGKKAAIKDVLGGQLGNVASAAQAAGGPIGALAGKIQGLAGIAGKVPPQVAAIIVAITAIVGVATAAAVTLLKLGEAAISIVQERSGLLAVFGAISGGATGGAKTLGIVDQMAKRLPFARAQIEGWAKDLLKVGLQGRDLENAMNAVASATAIMGESGGKAAQDLISKLALGGYEAAALVMKLKSGLPESKAMLAEMGLRVEDLAAAVGMTVQQFKRARLSARQMAEAVEKALVKKGAGPLGELAMTWPVLMAKLKEGFSSLFEKLGGPVKAFMKAVKDMFSQFGRGTPTMKFFQGVVTKVFTYLFGLATKAVKFLSSGFRQIVPAIQAVGKFFEPVGAIGKAVFGAIAAIVKFAYGQLKPWIGLLKMIFTNAMVLKGIKSVFVLIAAAIGVVIVVITALAAAIGVVIGIAAGFVGAIVGLVSGIFGALVSLGEGASSAASEFINGLIGGITGGASGVIAAVTALAQGAISAVKGILGIASPSKVMAKMGGFAAEGMAGGLDKGAAGVSDSAAQLGAGAAGGAAKGVAGAKGGKGSIHVEIHDGAIRISAGGAVIDNAGLALALEQLLASQGLGAT